MIGAPPELPPVLAHPPAAPMPPQAGHPPVALPPMGSGVHNPPLPPWLADPSPPGFQLVPPLDHPDPPTAVPSPAPTPSTSGGGSSFFPQLGHDLAEAGKTAGEGVATVGALLGALLLGGVTSSGQVAR